MKLRTRIAMAALLLAMIAVLAVGYFVLRRGFSARDEPSKIEAYVARLARQLATPASARNMQSPLANTEAYLKAGMEHFADHCAVCHANNGSGDTMYGRGMYPRPPDMRSAKTQQLTDGEIYSIIQNGIRLTGMPAFGSGRTDDKASWQLVQFIRHLPKLTEAEEVEMEKLNPRSPLEERERQEAEDFLSKDTEQNQSATPTRTERREQ